MDKRDKGKAKLVEEDAESSRTKDQLASPALTLPTSRFTSTTSRPGTSTSTSTGTSTSTDTSTLISNASQEEITIVESPSGVGTSRGARARATRCVSAGAPGGSGPGTTGTDAEYRSQDALLNTILCRNGHVRCMHAGHAGEAKMVYSGSDSKQIQAWSQGMLHAEIISSAPVNAIVKDAQHRIFSAHDDGAIRVWELDGWGHGVHKHVTTLEKTSDFIKNLVLFWRNVPLTCLCLSDNGAFIYSGSSDGTMRTWCLKDMKLVGSMRVHKIAVNAIETMPDGFVLTCASDGAIKKWKREVHGTNGDKVRHSLTEMMTLQSAVNALVYGKIDGTGLLYAGLSDGSIRFRREVAPRDEPGVLRYHSDSVSCLALSSGPFLFSGSRDKEICVWWRANEGRLHTILMVLTGHEGPVNCLAVTNAWAGEDADQARSCILYSGALDRTLKVWHIRDTLVVEGPGRG